ncbi:MAG TPA: phosphoglycerate dehydrogenase [Pirellulales bacterium]|jgi:phosphoglycerate dehydrogenase-like enzyme
MPRILVTPTLLRGVRGKYCEILEGAGFEITYPTVPEPELRGAALVKDLQGVSGVLAGSEPYTPDVLKASKLRGIARAGVGYDAVDLPTSNELKIAVTIAPGTNEHSVAEQTIALLFGVFRDVPQRDAGVRSGKWGRRPLWRLAGRTIGLVGLGRIGRAVVPRAVGLGLRVLGYDPIADRDFAAKNGVELCSLDDLFARSDIVSLHLPSTAETRDLINRRTLGLMRPGSVLINTSRGGLVDEDALVEALTSGHLAGAGLDVFKVEPLPTSSPLAKLENVVLAPHMGGVDEESAEAMASKAAQCLADLSRGQWPDGCVVNEQHIRTGWQW